MTTNIDFPRLDLPLVPCQRGQGDYYCYVLWNPLHKTGEFPDGTPFYVGKGKGNRAYQSAAGTNIDNADKLRTIENIRSAGKTPVISFPCGKVNEEYALAMERALIVNRRHLVALTNKTAGGERSGIFAGADIKRVKTTWYLDDECHNALIDHCAKLDKRQSAVVTEALRKYLKVGEEK